MKKNILLFIILVFYLGLTSCHDKAKDFKEDLREGVWYVYNIESDYKFYTGLTPGLKRYVRYLMDEKNLLFWPGDELIFSKKHIDVKSPGGMTYDYNYFFEGKYVQIGDYGVYYGLKPDGNREQMFLKFDKASLRKLLNDQGEDALLEEMNNLKRFHIIYELQRPVPAFAQIMSGIYVGELYDGTDQLIQENATLNLFWDGQGLNLSMDEQIILENGPRFYLEVPALQTKEGFTPGSYEFSGSILLQDPDSGEIKVEIAGRYNAAKTVTMDVYIFWRDQVYQLQYLKGIRQWDLEEMASAKSTGKGITLKAETK